MENYVFQKIFTSFFILHNKIVNTEDRFGALMKQKVNRSYAFVSLQSPSPPQPWFFWIWNIPYFKFSF